MTFDFCKSSAVGAEPLTWPDKRGKKSRESPQEGEEFGGCLGRGIAPLPRAVLSKDMQTEFKQTHPWG